MYSYDRRTAASTDLRRQWSNVVDKYKKGLKKDLADILEGAVPYLKSVGYDLDLRKSYLDVEQRASDGDRMSGMLTITEREENTTQSPNADGVRRWVMEALGIYGYPRKVSEGPEVGRNGQPLATWVVDIDES